MSHRDQADAAATVDVRALLWDPPTSTRRGPKPRFSLDEISEAAIAIADDEGLDAVTMQRIADRLGTAKMALYRYVPARADLDAALLDRALGTPPAIGRDDWRTALSAWASALREGMSARPWAVELAQRAHTPGPGELAWYERGLESVDGLALTGGEKLDLLALIAGHVMSNVTRETASATPEHDLATGLAPILEVHAAQYPRTTAAFAEAASGGEREAAPQFGMERVLAGIAALLEERGRRAPRPE